MTEETYVHEMFDHPASPVPDGCPPHDYSRPQEFCDACDLIAHAQYDQDIIEIVNGTVERDSDVLWIDENNQPRSDIPIDSAFHGPTKFLMMAHALKGYCALHKERSALR